MVVAMELFLLVAVLALLGLAAQQWGADTRITNLDPNDQTNSVPII
jgi:hypothetical protein